MLISYKNVNICQNGVRVLENVNFNVDPGEFIYIIGKVGSGKTSLLKTLYCELEIEKADDAEVNGRNLLNIKKKDIPALRREMGIIFQDFQLLHDRTVGKNLEFVLRATGWKNKKDIAERIDAVLKQVEMVDKKDKMPHELSGGEQQRIAIARAILNQPKIIIADEPTGNLDPETANNIIGLLKQISLLGVAVIMTTHNISLIDKYPGVVYRCEDHTLRDINKEYNASIQSDED